MEDRFEIVVVVAGLYASGTEAAGPPHWERKNLQVVISTEVIDRVPGPARVLATYSW